MSWLDSLTFYDSNPPAPAFLLEKLEDFVFASITDLERIELEISPLPVPVKEWEITKLSVPDEFKELLSLSDGGGILNGEREFGFFSVSELREYFLAYQFPIYMPNCLPIAFNGGGVFYVYDLRNPDVGHPIIAADAGVLDFEETAFLGHNLREVLSKSTNIEAELYGLHN